MKILNIHHASVVVGDLKIALGFYQDILELTVSDQRPDLGYPGAWLELGEQQIHLLQLPTVDPVNGRPAHPGRDRHLAVHLTGLEELSARLTGAGISYTLSRSGRKALFCRDPFGNGLEFIEE